MKMGVKLLTGAAVITMLSACGGKETKAPLECSYPDDPERAAPAWICERNHTGVAASAVGYQAKMAAGPSVSERRATLQARVKLVQEMRTKVNNMVKDFVKNTGAGDAQTVDTDYEEVTKQITSESLVGSKVMKVHTSPNGTVYVLVGLNPNSAAAAARTAVEKAAATSKGNENAMWQSFLHKKSQDELAAEMEKYNN